MLGRLLQELRRLLEHVLALGLVVGGDDVLGVRRALGLGSGAGSARGRRAGRRGLDLLERELARGLLDLGGGSGAGAGSAAPARARGSAGSGSTWWIGASRRSSAVTSSCRAVVVDAEVGAGASSAGLGGHGLVDVGLFDRGGRRVAAGGAQRLVLEACDLAGVGAVAPLELEVFLDRVVEQSHGAHKP